ncbi:MAG: TlpA family protein disulfide reductase [Legionellales bacterium]|nr:TlpA family protein disulfide reductase [Legionellales bacterium]
MKKLIIILTLILTFSGCAKPSPAIYNPAGQLWSLNDFQHQWLVINYWAAWCEACRDEIPQLNLFNQKAPQSMQLIGVNYDEIALAGLTQLAQKLTIQYPLLLTDPAAQLHLPVAEALPVTYILNPQQQRVKTLYGPHSAKELISIVQELQQHSS